VINFFAFQIGMQFRYFVTVLLNNSQNI